MIWFLPIIFGGLAAGLGSAAVVGLICAVISEWLDEDSISETIHNEKRFKDAIKAIVNDKSVRKVKVGIFDSSEQIGEMEIESSKGVANSVYVGQVIDLRY